MSKDGHCALDAETIYVQDSAGCVTSGSGAGTATVTYCGLQYVPAAVTPARNLVVVRGSVNNSAMAFGGNAIQLWIVGQQSALIGGVNVGIRLTAGEATIRDITISNSVAIGIQADTGSTLRLQHVTVSNNMAGGILLDGAAFDIQNTIVKNSGPGDMAGTAWGGIRIATLRAPDPSSFRTSRSRPTTAAESLVRRACKVRGCWCSTTPTPPTRSVRVAISRRAARPARPAARSSRGSFVGSGEHGGRGAVHERRELEIVDGDAAARVPRGSMR